MKFFRTRVRTVGQVIAPRTACARGRCVSRAGTACRGCASRPPSSPASPHARAPRCPSPSARPRPAPAAGRARLLSRSRSARTGALWERKSGSAWLSNLNGHHDFARGTVCIAAYGWQLCRAASELQEDGTRKEVGDRAHTVNPHSIHEACWAAVWQVLLSCKLHARGASTATSCAHQLRRAW